MWIGRYAAGSQWASMVAEVERLRDQLRARAVRSGPASFDAGRWSEFRPQPSFWNWSSAMTRQ